MSEKSLSERLNDVAKKIPEQLKQVLFDIYGTYESERRENESVRLENESERQKVMGNLVESLENIYRMINDGVPIFYPIGAVYISFEATSPSVLFGGTWEELTSGRFLMASNGDSGLEGGSEGHVHGLKGNAGAALAQGSSTYLEYEVTHIYETTEYGESPVSFYADRTLQTDYIGPYGNQNIDFVRLYGNTDSAASDLPPYITVHMWKRTA